MPMGGILILVEPSLVLKIVDQVNDFLEQNKNIPADLGANLKALLTRQLSQLDVVSREEFETQQRILLQTRTQIEQLEQQLRALEQHLLNDSGGSQD